MATFKVLLEGMPDRKQAPIFTWVQNGILGNQSIAFYPQKFYECDTVWQLIGASIHLVCDATVANRYPRLQIECGGTNTCGVWKGAAVTASSTEDTWIQKINWTNDVDFDTNHNIGIGEGFHLMSINDNVALYIQNGVAGDVYTVTAKFLYMNWLLGMPLPDILEKKNN